MLKILIGLIFFVGAGQLHGARPSTRNFKSLSQIEADTKAAEQREAELADGGHLKSAVEKIKFLGPKKGWGFVAKESASYTLTGKNSGVVQAGDLFKYNDVIESSKNDMLLAVIRSKEGWGAPCLLPCDAIAAYEGDPEQVDIQIVGDLRAYFLTKGRLESRQEELLQQEYQKNPYYKAYQQAAKEYNESIETALKMEQEASGLIGARKLKADEALREFKYRQVELQHQLNEVAQKYREWRERNSVDPSKIRDQQLDELRRELKAAKNKVADLVPADSIP